jgi:hypothetical protein
MSILVLVKELDSNLVVGECKELFPQAIVVLLLPFLGQEINNGIVATEEVGSISPDRVFGVCWCYSLWISVVAVRRANMWPTSVS